MEWGAAYGLWKKIQITDLIYILVYHSRKYNILSTTATFIFFGVIEKCQVVECFDFNK